MIQYSLHCSNGHRFDAWFKNAAAYDEQQARGVVHCAVCGDVHVEKALMAPALSRGAHKRGGEGVPLANAPPEAEKIREILRRYRQKIIEETEYVGDRFAEEARKIHFQEVEARGIHGEANGEDIVGLIEDGIDFFPIPDSPEDHN